MNQALYIFVRGLIAMLQSLPLIWVARLGRAGGALVFWLDARHRRVALENLQMCFGDEKSVKEICAIARENFRRIGENYCCAVKTAAMTFEQLRPHAEYIGLEHVLPPRRIVNAGGHFGNFELYARFKDLAPEYQCATTYRALKNPALNRLMEKMRERSGCLFFERRTDGAKLRAAMNQPAIIISLQIDQHGGKKGLRLPFLGHDCSTSPSPAIFALRYDCEFYAAACFRVGLAKWRLELGEKIPTHENGHPREIESLMRDVLRAQENYIRRDPANWFWVHRRWKPIETKVRSQKSEVGNSAAAR
ncbi:MAG: lysophospholipid acyltransferase family protein [Limisphaerales bacterium]